MTDHPCKGMSKAQRRAFELIAVNQSPSCKWDTIEELLRAGVIQQDVSETRRDAMGVYTIPHFYVPLPVHMQWCEWCSEQPGNGEL